MRQLKSLRTRLSERAQSENQPRLHEGELAEDYDGYSQTASVQFSRNSIGMNLEARLAVGDFHSGVLVPKGTPVTLHIEHGRVTIISLGYK